MYQVRMVRNGVGVIPQLGAIGIVDPTARANTVKVATGVAMLGGGIYALLAMGGAKKTAKYSLGALGAGLLIGGLVSGYDALAK